MIEKTFERTTAVAVIIPGGDYEKEAALLEELKKTDGVNSAVGLNGIEVADGIYLTDNVTVSDVAALGALDEGNVGMLFRLYGVEKGLLTSVFDDTPISAPLVDLIAYYADHSDGEAEGIASAVKLIRQLKGKEHDRLVLTSSLPSESGEARALVETIREESDAIYGAGETIVTGDITSARDLSDSFGSDRVLISALTVIFVFTVLMFTFRTPVGSALLVLLIQGSIWCNFAVAYLIGMKASFVTEMITTAVQMGATIDYAIVMMNRYLSARKTMEKKEAAVQAVKDSFATVLTSGAIMTAAGFLIAFGVTNVYVGHIGLAVGRGAAFSVALVLTVLPPVLVIFDRAITGTVIGKKRRGVGGAASGE